MKRETRRAKLLEFLDEDEDAELIARLKHEIPKGELETIAENDARHEAESVLAYRGSYEEFVKSICVSCGKPFAHSYAKVTTCSVVCLQKALAEIGIDWDPSRSVADRWRPKQIPHLSVSKLKGESQVDFEGRQRELQKHSQTHHPIPLIVPSEAAEILDNLQVVPLENVPEKSSADKL